MVVILYGIIGIVAFFASLIITSIVTKYIGPGPYEAGIVHNAIILLIATSVVCTTIIVSTIKKTFKNKKD